MLLSLAEEKIIKENSGTSITVFIYVRTLNTQDDVSRRDSEIKTFLRVRNVK